MLFGGGRDCHLDVLEGQLHLVGVELLGARPEAGPLQLAHQVLEPVIARAKIGILRLEMLAQLGLGRQRLSQLRLDRGPQVGRQPGQEIGIERVRHANDLYRRAQASHHPTPPPNPLIMGK